MNDFILQRNGKFYFSRRVPSHLKRLDPREYVRLSLKTSDEKEANRRAVICNGLLEKYWDSIVIKSPDHPDSQWSNVVAHARLHNFTYRVLADLIKDNDFKALHERMKVAEQMIDNPPSVKALIGLNTPSHPKLSQLETEYLDYTKDRLTGKSLEFIRKWENPKKRALQNLIKAIGDIEFVQVTRKEMGTFRKWWMDRIISDGLSTGTALKDIAHLKDIFRTMFIKYDIEKEVESLFLGITFKNTKKTRSAFEADFVQKQILKPENLSGLNDEAKAIIHIMADTGARVNEVVGLLPEDIFINSDIPFIWIRPNGKRTLKNATSNRQIPLVGAALHGVKMVLNGFPRYETADSVSNLINQYLMENKLRPTEEHTLYSLRHTFKDRLRDAWAPEEVIDELMGHAGHRPKYGRGHTLETKHKWLDLIKYKI